MKIRWSPDAADDLSHIVHYIREDNPSAALRVARKMRENIAMLKRFPRLGRRGRMEGTYELVLSPLPFIIVYRIREEFVEICKNIARGTALAAIRVIFRPISVISDKFPLTR